MAPTSSMPTTAALGLGDAARGGALTPGAALHVPWTGAAPWAGGHPVRSWFISGRFRPRAARSIDVPVDLHAGYG